MVQDTQKIRKTKQKQGKQKIKQGEEFGEDDILKRMPSDERWYGNLEIKGSNDKNCKRRKKETGKKEIMNLSVCVHDTKINGTEALQGR